MSITVDCPGCGKTMRPPDSAAGKRLKCLTAGCGTIVSVPLDDDEEDTDDYERPSKRKRDLEYNPPRKQKAKSRPKPKKSGQMPVPLIVAIVLGGILLLGGGGYGIYALAFKKKETAKANTNTPSGNDPSTPPSRLPAGWQEFRSDQDHFKMLMPPAPRQSSAQGSRNYIGVEAGTDKGVIVHVAQLPPGLTPAQLATLESTILKKLPNLGQEVSRRQVQFVGQTVTEAHLELTGMGGQRGLFILRLFRTADRIYVVGIGSPRGAPDLTDADAIFDTFQLLK